MKILKYRSENSNNCGNVQVDTSKYKTIEDLKPLIMHNCNLDKDYYIKFNPHQESKIENIQSNSEIKLSIFRYIGLYFRFPNIKQFRINFCFDKKFLEIIDLFKKNNVYLSFKCIESMKWSCNKKELKKDGKPLQDLKSDSYVDIEYGSKTVTLYYGYKKFIFCEDEQVITPKNFIKGQYKECESVKIRDINQKRELNDNDKLKSYGKYQVKVVYKVTFNRKTGNIPTTIMLDFLTTIKEAQEEIAKRNSTSVLRIKPEFIKIYKNVSQTEVYDSFVLLKDIHSLKFGFYYEIKVGVKNANPKNDQMHKHQQNFNGGNNKEYSNLFHPNNNHKEAPNIKKSESNESKNKIFNKPKASKETSGGHYNQKGKNYNQKPSYTINYDENESESSDKKTKQSIRKYKPKQKDIIELSGDNEEIESEADDKAMDKEEKSLKVVIIVNRIGGGNLIPLRRDLPLDMKISDLKDIISEKYKNVTKVDIKCKKNEHETAVKSDATIGDIKNKIRDEKGGDYKYTLYAYIEQPKIDKNDKANSSSSSDDDENQQENKKGESSSNDDDKGGDLDFRKNKNKKADCIKKKRKISSDDDDDIENLDENKKRSKTIKPKRFDSSGSNDDDEIPYKNKKRPKTDSPKSRTKKLKFFDSSNNDNENSDKQSTLSKLLETSSDDDEVETTPKKSQVRITTYKYQYNSESKLCSIKLDSNATVKTMKEQIAKKRGIKNLKRIKIIFAGKELLDDILLEPLEVEGEKIFVYAQEVDEIFVNTAKALRFDRSELDDDNYK